MASAEQTQQDNIVPKETTEAESGVSPAKDETSQSEPALPPLSPHEFRQYNRLADRMNDFVSLHEYTPPPLNTLSRYIRVCSFWEAGG